jgi:serine/threonine protein phosphatase PrpC
MGTRDAPDSERRWGPIAIGQSIVEFQPRPPLVRGYRPDTVADGWDSEHFAVRAASVRGYLHRFRGTPRQDDLAIAVHPGTQVLVLAVADGVSSATHAHVGSAVVCRSVVESVLDALDGDVAVIDWTALLRRAAWALVEQAGRHLKLAEPDPVVAERTTSTTLVAGVVRPGRGGCAHASLVRVGDSSAWLLRDGVYLEILPGKPRDAGSVVPSEVSALPRVPPTIEPVEVTVPPDAVLLMGTDGFGDAVGDGSGEIGALFARNLSTAPPPLGLAHLLDFSRETFDDDRTLVAVWPRARRS